LSFGKRRDGFSEVAESSAGDAAPSAFEKKGKGWMRRRIGRLITCPRDDVQIKIERETMVKAFRRWLEANGLLVIVTGVIGALVALSLLLVLGGYLLVTR